MKRNAYLAGLWIGVAAVVGIPASPAVAGALQASAGVVEVSGDGIVYIRDYNGLFNGQILVPQGKATDSFVVRNDGDSRGYLRVVLTAVDIPNRDVLDALTISASTTTRPGTPVLVSAVQPCLTLLSGQPIASGHSVRVNSELALGNLTATHGQGVSIGFRLEVLLSERADQNADGCPIAESTPAVPGGHLAATGLTGLWGVGAAGVMLMAVGSALAVWLSSRGARRRESVGNDD
jgi:hypothetical protein